MSHTPGPWKAKWDDGMGLVYIVSGDGPYSMMVTDLATIATLDGIAKRPREELGANARLIAAAPELREALANLVMDQGPCEFDHEGYCQAHGVSKPCVVAAGLNALYKADGHKS